MYALLFIVILFVSVVSGYDVLPTKVTNAITDLKCTDSIGTSADRVAVGCILEQYVLVFKMSTQGVWELEKRLDSKTEGYGSSIFFNDDGTVMSVMTSESVQIHEYTQGDWTPADKCSIKIDGFGSEQYFGFYTALKPDYILISAPAYGTVDTSEIGTVFTVPYASGCKLGTPIQFKSEHPVEEGYFSHRTSIIGDQILISASGEDDGHTCNSGRLYLFNKWDNPTSIKQYTVQDFGKEITCEDSMRFGIANFALENTVLLGGDYDNKVEHAGVALYCSYNNLQFQCKDIVPPDAVQGYVTDLQLTKSWVNPETQASVEIVLAIVNWYEKIYIYDTSDLSKPQQIIDLSTAEVSLDYVAMTRFHMFAVDVEKGITCYENIKPHTPVPTPAPTPAPTAAPTPPTEAPTPGPDTNWTVIGIGIGSGVVVLLFALGLGWYLRKRLFRAKKTTYDKVVAEQP